MYIPLSSPYIKGSDLPTLLKTRRRNLIISGVFLTFCALIINVAIGSLFSSFYTQSGTIGRNLYLLAIIISAISLIAYWVFVANVFSEGYKQQYLRKIKNYKPTETVHVSKVFFWKETTLVLMLTVIACVLILGCYMLPVFLVLS